MIYISNELSHYGVKGMKWGVRKTRPRKTKHSTIDDELRQLRLEEAKEEAQYKKKTSGWSETQKLVYGSTGKLIDPKYIKEKPDGSVVVDMGTYIITYHKDGGSSSRPKRKK